MRWAAASAAALAAFDIALASGGPAECAAAYATGQGAPGACLRPALSEDAADGDVAIGLVQRGLWYKSREVRLGEIPANSTWPPCSAEDAALYPQVPPMALPARAQVEVFREIGLVGHVPSPCARGRGQAPAQALSLITWLDHKTIEEKNKLASTTAMAFFSVLTALILWNLISVLSVARKKDWENQMTQRKLHLADESEAFKRGWMHWLSLTWVDGLMGRYGKCAHAVVNDAEIVEDRNDSEYLPYVRFRMFWKEQVALHGVENAWLTYALYRTVGLRATVLLIAAVFSELLLSMVGMVVALDRFLRHLEDMSDEYTLHPERPISLLEPTLVVLIAIFGVPFLYRAASIISALLDGYYCNMCAAGLASIVFEKALSLPVGVKCTEEDGKKDVLNEDLTPNVVQILNVDIIEMWSSLLKQIVTFMFAPLFAVVMFVMLIKQLKLAGFLGILYIIPCAFCTFLGQLVIVSFWTKYQRCQDVRLRSLTETVVHIRTIKSLAWESLSYERLNEARIAELQSNQKAITAGGMVMGFMHTAPWFCMLIALFAYLKFHGEIRAHQIIVVQRLMGSLLSALALLGQGVRKWAQAPLSFRRIKAYLAQHERPEGVVKEPSSALPTAPAVRLQGTFTYVEDLSPVLHDLDVSIPRGELVAVIGQVASGKSSILQTILGDLFPVGHSYVEAPNIGSGTIAYCAQLPWIFEGTLKENVLMRNPFDDERYHKALYSAALLPDLQILPGGDMVTIGSNGIRLSGGQRSRVALARAAYMEKVQVFVIDDPFASVDVPTGNHLLEELLLGQLMQGKTRIVVTQPGTRLQKFDRVLLVKDGRIVACGPPAEVMETKEYSALLAAEDESSADPAKADARDPTSFQRAKPALQRASEASKATSLRDIEAQDHITWDSIKWWFQAAGYKAFALFVAMTVLQRMLMLRESVAIATWIDDKTFNLEEANDGAHIMVIVGYVCACVVVIAGTSYAASLVSLSASTKMHQTVVGAILRAPIDKFFDKQPVGRLINRLSFDMRQVDDYIPLACVALMMFFFGFCVTQSFILSAVSWKIGMLSVPFYATVAVYIYLYRGTCVPMVFHAKFALSNLQDLQAVVTTTAISIRSNGMFDDFIARYNHQSASIIRCQYLIHYVCKAWVQSRVFLTFCTLTCLFALGGLWTRMPMGTLATIVSLSLNQMTEFESISTDLAHFLNILNALQRLTNYFRIPQEAPAVLPSDPVVRFRVCMERAAVPKLDIRRGAEAQACRITWESEKETRKVQLVVLHEGKPVLRASRDGLALELVPGARLRDIFPQCPKLKEQPTDANAMYHIVAVNSVVKDAERMADELVNPPAKLWLDFWLSSYAGGMRVMLDDLTVGYGKDKSVLESVKVDIPPRCKLGIAGKTGCGKSTTLLCVLRILELRSGRILIGDLDIAKIGLNALRAMVGLVPQDPTVFGGTWRYNIDPFNEFPDGRIWEALQCVQLLPYIRTLPKGIDSELAREGANISFGQRQLLSLARMVIRQPPVLLLDECTSALDPNTQQAAQSTLLNEFPMSTIIAIAHRVETLLDFDRIVVFDKGTVVEEGTVKEVMNIENGIFRGMAAGGAGAHVADDIKPAPVKTV